MALFLAFLLVPLIEIGLFIQVGGWIGLWPTLAIVMGTAILGTWLVRREGLLALAQVQDRMRSLRDPTEPLAHGALIIFAGALLLTPGFFTDTCGLLLLIPAVRAGLMRMVRARMRVRAGLYDSFVPPDGMYPDGMHTEAGYPTRSDPQVLDGEYFEVDPGSSGSRPPSGWTRR